ncbi:unnamed protein product [Chrysoparadoxa australica]
METGSEVSRNWTDAEWEDASKELSRIGSELVVIGADGAEGTVRRILIGLGFTQQMQDGPTDQLSGGWRMRVALATALFMEPKLLLLDEPTNHLDLSAVIWLVEYLATRWKGTLLVVSHDQDFLDNVCTDIIHLSDLKLNYYGAGIDRFRSMQSQVDTKLEKDYKLEQTELAALKKKGHNAEKAEQIVLRKFGRLALLERPKEYKVKFKLKDPEDRIPSIDLLDVSFGFDKKRPLFKGLRLRVDTDTRVAVVGPNGAGKSTLLNLISGKIEPREGQGEVVHHRYLKIGRYDQHFEELLPPASSPAAFLVKEYNVTMQQARAVLGMFGLDGARHLINIHELSGGQKARVVFASLSLQQPHILLLDEPTNHLDLESIQALIDGINAFKGGVIIVSHDSRLISATECVLWVCPGDGSLRTHDAGGFERYRRTVLREITEREAKLEAEAAARAIARQKSRQERVDYIKLGGKKKMLQDKEEKAIAAAAHQVCVDLNATSPSSCAWLFGYTLW